MHGAGMSGSKLTKWNYSIGTELRKEPYRLYTVDRKMLTHLPTDSRPRLNQMHDKTSPCRAHANRFASVVGCNLKTRGELKDMF